MGRWYQSLDLDPSVQAWILIAMCPAIAGVLYALSVVLCRDG